MKLKLLVGAALLSLPMAANAGPVQAEIAPVLVNPTLDDLNNGTLETGADNFTGVGEIVMFVKEEFGGGAFVCTASLVNSNTLLTAAHCLDSGNRGTRGQAYDRIEFRTGANWRNPDQTYTAKSIALNPDFIQFDEAGGPENDIALVRLDGDVSNGEEFYDIYRGSDEFGQVHTKVGGGTTGYGDAGRTATPTAEEREAGARGGLDGYKRSGQNVYENINSIFGYSDGFLLTDFDNGNEQNDLFGFLAAIFPEFLEEGLTPEMFFETGIVDENGVVIDYGVGGGDSGGPTFINGLIAGVTSFGGSTGQFFGGCGPNSGLYGPDIDSNADGEQTEAITVDGGLDGDGDGIADAGLSCLNSSYGEFAGDTRVSRYADWFDNALAGGQAFSLLVPEPGAVGLLGLGVLGLFAARRRRAA
ncbi:MAG: trypsin-like serine protease [Pseudomonadota bacterium]